MNQNQIAVITIRCLIEKKLLFVCACVLLFFIMLSLMRYLYKGEEKKKKKEHRRICGDLIFYLPKWSRNTQDEEDIVKIARIYGL